MRVLDFAPPPTTPPDFGDTRQLARAGTQAAAENAPGASVAVAVRDSQRIGMAILPALRAGDYAGAAAAIVQSAAAAVLGAVPGAHALPAFAGIIKAYHGSPHTFDEFKLEKVGTGEGAQAYGHGLYFAEKQGVAEGYQKTLSQGRGTIDGRDITDILLDKSRTDKRGAGSVVEQIAQELYDNPGPVSLRSSLMQRGPDVVKAYDDMVAAGRIRQSEGALYHVDLDVKPEELLDWDKPLSQQAPGVVEKLKGLGVKLDSRPGDDVIRAEIDRLEAQQQAAGTRHPVVENDIGRLRALLPDPTGGEIYESSKLVPGKYSDPAAASAALHAAGIPGIKYLDQGSRAAGDGTSNFVIFDPSVIAMVSRNGQPLVSSADKARDGLAVLAHPDAWQPGGAK